MVLVVSVGKANRLMWKIVKIIHQMRLVLQPLADELVLDVGVDDYVQDNHKMFNMWGDMNVNDIPLDIDTDTDSSTNNEPVIVKAEKPPDVVFSPLSNIEHLNSAKKCSSVGVQAQASCYYCYKAQ